MTSASAPSAAVSNAPAATTDLDSVVQRVKSKASEWAKLPIAERIRLLGEMRKGYASISADSVVAACHAKGIDPDSPLAGEEWLGGPLVTIRNLRLLQRSLEDIQKHGVPQLPGETKILPDGRLAVKVFPADRIDAVLLPKHEAWVHLERGITRSDLKEHQASFYRAPHGGRVCAVLGAGNVNAIPGTDALHKLFVDGAVVVLKMNPVNAYLGPFLEKAFRVLVDRGYFAVVYGGPEEGKRLVDHPAVDEVHITGSDKTHDVMVWGPPGPEREARKQRNDPVMKKALTSELGNVSPVIVVPGPYSGAELGYQGANIAGMMANNASFNCNSPKLLVSSKSWAQRPALLAALENGLAKAKPRKAYYPGAEERWKWFTEGRKGLKTIGNAGPGELPWAIIPDVDPNQADDRVFTHEPWCALISETAVEGEGVEAFLERAVAFVNEKVWGTLSATLIVHPATMKDPKGAAAVEKAIRDLRYGSVVVNTWPGATFGLISTPWGGHPSTDPKNIQSGRGWAHNSYMLDGIEKVVLTAPVKQNPVPPWYPAHRSLDRLARRLVELETDPSWLKLPGIVSAALKS